jgi:hypothetical protein
MTKFKRNYAIQLSNQLFATVLKAPRAELLDVEIADDHDIEVDLVHRTLDRYVTSGWLDMKVVPRPLNRNVRLYTVTPDYKDRPLVAAEAPLKMAEKPVSEGGSKRKPPKPDLAAKDRHDKLVAFVAAPAAPVGSVTPPSEAAPSASPSVEAVKPTQTQPTAQPEASSKETPMPRGIYKRDPVAPKKSGDAPEHKFSCALFDDDRLIVRAGGKSVELAPDEIDRLAAYMRRTGLFHDFVLAELVPGISEQQAA